MQNHSSGLKEEWNVYVLCFYTRQKDFRTLANFNQIATIGQNIQFFKETTL